jgi:integrase/recombinase XerC/integrase/recombinase XerD
LARADLEALQAREDLGLRGRVLWRLPYETARAGEVLTLGVEELALRNRCTKVRRKGNAVDVIVWQTSTAGSCPGCCVAVRPGPCS